MDAEYVCQSCGEVIVIPVDVSVGRQQEYVEDCPVCCHPNVITIAVDVGGHMIVRSELES